MTGGDWVGDRGQWTGQRCGQFGNRDRSGLGQQLNIGRELNAMDLVIASIVLILVVGVAIELLVFAPVERRVLRARGLTVARSR